MTDEVEPDALEKFERIVEGEIATHLDKTALASLYDDIDIQEGKVYFRCMTFEEVLAIPHDSNRLGFPYAQDYQ